MSARFVPVDDLVTVDDIAERLHWSVNTTLNIVTGRDGRYKLKFPRPLVGRAKRGVWLWTDVMSWFEETTPKTIERRKRSANRTPTMRRHHDWSNGRKSA